MVGCSQLLLISFSLTLDCWFTYAKAMREFRNGLFAFHVQTPYLIIWGHCGVTELITASLAFVRLNSFTLTVLYCLRGATCRTFAFVHLNDFLLFSNACKCSVYKASRYMPSCNLTYWDVENVDLASENFQPLKSSVFIGDERLCHPAFWPIGQIFLYFTSYSSQLWFYINNIDVTYIELFFYIITFYIRP